MKNKHIIENNIFKKIIFFCIQNLITIGVFYFAFTAPFYSTLADNFSSNQNSLFVAVIIINMAIPLFVSSVIHSVILKLLVSFEGDYTTEKWCDNLLFFISPIVVMAVAAGIPVDTGDLGISLSIPIMSLSSIILGYKFSGSK